MKVKRYISLMVALVALVAIVMPLRAAVTDAQIVASLKDTYVFKTFLKGDDVKIQSNDGVVTLTGVVSSSSRKLLADMTAAVDPGVRKVDNQLTVKGAEPAPNSDAGIKDRVETTLALHRSVNDSQIEVSVKDGKVTLSGYASSQAKKELATEYTKDLDGVKDVDNQMTVSGSGKTVTSSAKNGYNKSEGFIDDASITAQVKYALLSHRGTSVLKTSVDTKNGVVTVSGKAKNAAEKTLVSKLVNDIKGVKSVNNQMTIEP
jgi:osmotically-inducible protein OsmY